MESTKRRAWPSRLMLIGAGVCLASSALAVDVKGSVRSSEEAKPKPVEGVRAPYWQEWNGFIEPKKTTVDYAREVAVVLIGAEGMRDAATVLLQDGTLTPSTVVMQKGTALRVRNEDDFAHQLYAEGLKAFDPVETTAGHGRQVQIDQVGSFPLRDQLASHVRGHLHVLPKVTAIANPQADGSFVFRGVAPGPYTLKVFRGAQEVSSSELQIQETRELVVDPIAVDTKPGK